MSAMSELHMDMVELVYRIEEEFVGFGTEVSQHESGFTIKVKGRLRRVAGQPNLIYTREHPVIIHLHIDAEMEPPMVIQLTGSPVKYSLGLAEILIIDARKMLKADLDSVLDTIITMRYDESVETQEGSN